MNWQEQIEQELGKAASGLREKNDGLARVCARRAVGLAVQAWIERSGVRTWPPDVMNQLRKIQQQEAFPKDMAQRLLDKTKWLASSAEPLRHDIPQHIKTIEQTFRLF